VDHAEFTSSSGVEQVVGEWRRTGLQRFAWLFGEIVPRSCEHWDLGVKCLVRFVVQPKQESGVDGVRLEEDDSSSEHAKIAAGIVAPGSQLIGCLYTDLKDDGSGTGNVLPRPYFLSSPELAFLVAKQSTQKRFFACVVSGSSSGKIEIEAYMASQVAVTFLNDLNFLAPTTDPNSLLIKRGEFVYTIRNEYGYDVPVRAKTGDILPVEYFVVSLTHGFQEIDEVDSFPPLYMYPTMEQAMEAVSNGQISFNLFIYLLSKNIIGNDYLANFTSDPHAVLSGIYEKLLEYCESSDKTGWTCPHCTFINEDNSMEDCAVCGLPRS
jgi:hypothetical protein